MEGVQSLHAAVKANDIKGVKRALDEGQDINGQDDRGLTALYLAADAKALPIVKFLLQHGANPNIDTRNFRPILHKAVQSGSLEMVNACLEHAADISHCDGSGEPALHRAVRDEFPLIVETLLIHGANANARNKFGWTPLHVSGSENSSDTAELLITHGADVNARDCDGRTPIYHAVKWKSWNVMDLLLSQGAEVNAQDNGGQSVLHLALQQKRNYFRYRSPAYLMSEGGRLDEDMPYDFLNIALEDAVSRRFAHIIDNHLSWARDKQSWDVLKRLKADILPNDDLDLKHPSLRHYFNNSTNDSLDDALDNPDLRCYTTLIGHEIDVNLQDKNGRTALQDAALGGLLPEVKYLLRLGADISIQDTNGHTAAQLARVAHYLRRSETSQRIVKVLIAAEAKRKTLEEKNVLLEPKADDLSITLTLHRSPSLYSSLRWAGLRWFKWPRLRPGDRRLEWQCDCGDYLHADFPAHEVEAFNNLSSSLQSHSQTSIPTSESVEMNSSQEQNTKLSGSLDTKSSQDSSQSSSIPLNGLNTDSTAQPALVQPKYLGLIVNTGGIYKTLVEIDTSVIKNDAQMFLAMKETYLKLRDGSWLRNLLRIPVTVEHIHFTLWNRRDGYISVLDRPKCIPPIGHAEYEYDPKPPIPMPPDTFIHYLQHKEGDLHSARNDWFPRLPKRLIGRVIDKEETTCGWGLHIIEGENRAVIICIYWTIGFLAALFGILWTTIRDDMQGGMATAAFMVTLPYLILEGFKYRVNGL
ncbi:hypothetical protein BJY04DRAFT_220170 [Aspergillus karnatakaensis]|uniref:uncharacterized protein n=1 Tax=Aspergillus karnatakaensis TaxID=1810916 RepID=UPI003CCCBBD4